MSNKQPKEIIDLEDVIYDLKGIKNLITSLPSIVEVADGFNDACSVLANALNERIKVIEEIFNNEWRKKDKKSY